MPSQWPRRPYNSWILSTNTRTRTGDLLIADQQVHDTSLRQRHKAQARQIVNDDAPRGGLSPEPGLASPAPAAGPSGSCGRRGCGRGGRWGRRRSCAHVAQHLAGAAGVQVGAVVAAQPRPPARGRTRTAASPAASRFAQSKRATPRRARSQSPGARRRSCRGGTGGEATSRGAALRREVGRPPRQRCGGGPCRRT